MAILLLVCLCSCGVDRPAHPSPSNFKTIPCCVDLLRFILNTILTLNSVLVSSISVTDKRNIQDGGCCVMRYCLMCSSNSCLFQVAEMPSCFPFPHSPLRS